MVFEPLRPLSFPRNSWELRRPATALCRRSVAYYCSAALLERLHGSDEGLAGKTVLLVDDDARNIFALSSQGHEGRP